MYSAKNFELRNDQSSHLWIKKPGFLTNQWDWSFQNIRYYKTLPNMANITLFTLELDLCVNTKGYHLKKLWINLLTLKITHLKRAWKTWNSFNLFHETLQCFVFKYRVGGCLRQVSSFNFQKFNIHDKFLTVHSPSFKLNFECIFR